MSSAYYNVMQTRRLLRVHQLDGRIVVVDGHAEVFKAIGWIGIIKMNFLNKFDSKKDI